MGRNPIAPSTCPACTLASTGSNSLGFVILSEAGVRRTNASESKDLYSDTSSATLPAPRSRYNTSMRRGHIIFFVTLFFLLGIPAHAYADPTSVSFLQILFPMLAAAWAVFLVFAKRIRTAVATFARKLWPSKPNEPAA
jgi:hypothetical protein